MCGEPDRLFKRSALRLVPDTAGAFRLTRPSMQANADEPRTSIRVGSLMMSAIESTYEVRLVGAEGWSFGMPGAPCTLCLGEDTLALRALDSELHDSFDSHAEGAQLVFLASQLKMACDVDIPCNRGSRNSSIGLNVLIIVVGDPSQCITLTTKSPSAIVSILKHPVLAPAAARATSGEMQLFAVGVSVHELSEAGEVLRICISAGASPPAMCGGRTAGEVSGAHGRKVVYKQYSEVYELQSRLMDSSIELSSRLHLPLLPKPGRGGKAARQALTSLATDMETRAVACIHFLQSLINKRPALLRSSGFFSFVDDDNTSWS